MFSTCILILLFFTSVVHTHFPVISKRGSNSKILPQEYQECFQYFCSILSCIYRILDYSKCMSDGIVQDFIQRSLAFIALRFFFMVIVVSVQLPPHEPAVVKRAVNHFLQVGITMSSICIWVSLSLYTVL